MLCALPHIWCDQVDAYYYPNMENLAEYQRFLDVGSVQECGDGVFAAARDFGDPDLVFGDCECGIGSKGKRLGDLTVYRETVW